MAHRFVSGEIVICIDNRPYRRSSKAARLRFGGIYRVEQVLEDGWGSAGVTLVGVDHRPAHGWYAFRFKPLRGASDDFQQELKSRLQTEGESVPA